MTRSLTRETLVETTAEELVTYLRSGAVNTDALAQSLDYDGLEITDWERLKRIHFCLADDVHAFVTALPDRVRRIKTEHQREALHTRGEIRGSIDWSGTLRSRSETGYADRTRFVCNTPYTEYDIAENRVLKRLLWQIHRTVTSEFADIDYAWRQEYWTDEQLRRFDRLYKQNVHLNRIADGQDITVTGQDMTTARRARHTLYTQAYDLYETYQRLQADTFDPDIAALLADTLIVPASTPTLFELFTVFRLIRHIGDTTDSTQISPVDGDSDALAQITTDDQRIVIHHDSTGTLDFREPLDPDDPPAHPTFNRYHNALVDYSNARQALTGDDHDPVLYNGRPDIVIEMYDTTTPDETLDTVLIGEVKHTDKQQTFRQGLKELHTYRQFAAYDDTYLLDDQDVSVTSILITNGISTAGTSDTVTHLNGSDLLDDGTAKQPIVLTHC